MKLAKQFLTALALLWLPSAAMAASASNGYRALTEQSPQVKDPSANALINITRADKRLVAVGVHGLIVLSDDNGKTWRQANVPVDLTLTAVYFKDAETGWAVGHYGVILQSDDGGGTWRIDVTGLDVIKAMVAVEKQMQSTDPNGGDTALQTKVANYFSLQGPDQPFLSVAPCGAGILAVGSKDMAMFSTDNGATWQDWTPNISNPTFRLIYDQFQSGAVPVLVGETGLVATGDAGCAHLAALPDTNMPTLFGGMALKDGSILVYGLSGTAAKSKDLGTTWQQINLPTQSLISSGVLLPSGDIVLGTIDGQLLLSKDNGQTFSISQTTVPFQIAAMTIAADNSLVVAGDGGIDLISANTIN